MTVKSRLALFLAMLFLNFGLSACSDPIVLPPAQPLNASAQQLAAIPGLQPGKFRVKKGVATTWTADEQTMRLRIVQPQGHGPFPLVIFSHGFASDIDKYDALFEHWASHGYLIIAPYHLDGGGLLRGIYNSMRKGNSGLIAARVADVKFVLDQLPQLDQIEPGISTKINADRIAVAGHSFGAFTAQQFAGAASVDPDTGSRIDGRDERVRAVVAVSPPGRMFGLINEESWLQMDKPMLATTGTWDVDGRFVTDWQQHRLSFDTAKPGSNWLVVIQGADHYLGNLICRPERDEPPQPDALAMVNANAVTFLDAYLKGDVTAIAYLNTQLLGVATNGYATLAHR